MTVHDVEEDPPQARLAAAGGLLPGGGTASPGAGHWDGLRLSDL